MTQTMKEAKRAAVVAALKETGGNMTHAAKLLGISQRGMRLLVRRFNLTDHYSRPADLIRVAKMRRATNEQNVPTLQTTAAKEAS